MAHFLITYDLRRPGQDYRDLFSAIAQVGEEKHGLQNAWFVKSKYSASQIRDYLKKQGSLDANDKLFVAEINDWASSNMKEVSDWLNGN